MRKYVKIILIACGVGILIIAFLCYIYLSWIILPTESSRHTLTLVRYGSPRIHQITMTHYVNDAPINDYILELKIELRNQQPHKYTLPKVNEGRVVINVELMNTLDENIGNLTINYDEVSDLHEKGLLIYTATNYKSSTYIGDFVYYDQYVYFVSGQETRYYFEKAGTSEWSIITDAPQLKRFTREERGYSPHRYGLWEENEWVVSPGSQRSQWDIGLSD